MEKIDISHIDCHEQRLFHRLVITFIYVFRILAKNRGGVPRPLAPKDRTEHSARSKSYLYYQPLTNLKVLGTGKIDDFVVGIHISTNRGE